MSDYIIKPGTVIEVTDKHIDKGKGSECSSCAVSLALKEHVPTGVKVQAGYRVLVIIDNNDMRKVSYTPAHVVEFIGEFDRLKDGKGPRPDPISFEMPEVIK